MDVSGVIASNKVHSREPINSAFYKCLIILNKQGVLNEDEMKILISKNIKLENNCLNKKNQKDLVLSYVNRIIFLVNLHCLLLERLKIRIDENGSNKAKIRIITNKINKWFGYYLFMIFNKYNKIRPFDLHMNLTAIDLILKSGFNKKFEIFISNCILLQPDEFYYWKIAIKRKLELGKYRDALILAQKAYKHHPKDRELELAIKKIALSISLAIKLNEKKNERNHNIA